MTSVSTAPPDEIHIRWEPSDNGARSQASPTRPTARLWSIAPFVPFVIALLLAIYRAIGAAATPDEVAFLQTTVEWRSGPHGLVPPNALGYGSAWWSILAVFSSLFGAIVPAKQDIYLSTASHPELHALAASRLASVALLFGAVGFAMAKAPNKAARWGVCAFLLLPVAWFSGKWSAPDLTAVALLVMAASTLARGKTTAAALWMGIAIGIRLSNLFIVLGFLALAVIMGWKQRGFVRGAVLAAVAVVGGYVIGNPWVLAHPVTALQNTKGLAPIGVTNTLRIAIAKDLFKGGASSVEWDSASRGSLLFWYGSPVAVLAVLAYQLVLRQWALFLASLVGAAALIGAVAYRGLGYGWYVMPLVAMTYVVTMTKLPPARLRFSATNIVALAMGVGLILAVPTSYNQYAYVVKRTHSLQQVSQNLPCILNALPADTPVASLIDPVVVPQSLLDQRDAQPSYFAMRLFLTNGPYPKNLTVITTQPVIDKIGYWVTPVLNATGQRVSCGPFIIGRPAT